MASNRIGRINEEIQRELSDQLRRLKDPRVSQVGMVSITRVDTTGDLRYARVYVSVLDKTQEKEVLKGLKSAAGLFAAGAGPHSAAALHAGAAVYRRRLHPARRSYSGGAAPGGAGDQARGTGGNGGMTC